jgi:hypothetical protein
MSKMTKEDLEKFTMEEKELLIAKTIGRPTGSRICCGGDYDIYVPRYCRDLNEMHEAERWLEGDKLETYTFWLSHLCDLGTYTRASALQRADAFLLTVC